MSGWLKNKRIPIDSIRYCATVKDGQCRVLTLTLTYNFGLGSENIQGNVQNLFHFIKCSFVITYITRNLYIFIKMLLLHS